MAWQSIAASKRESLAASIPSEWRIPPSQLPSKDIPALSFLDSPFFTARDIELTSLSATALLKRLHSREWTSEEVTRAYCKRAAAAQQLTNCLAEILFPSAIARAKELDAHLATTGQIVGPLHGLPISLKDNFEIPGVESSVGYVGWLGTPATKESALVTLLREMGAVAYVKTNVPTAMMIAETVNNVLGRTTNPRNGKLTAGGSSGGEGALIAFGGSCLGVGSDIGGSLRIPAAMCGLFTLRPSFGRFPTGGTKSGLPGQEAVNGVNGPMARTLEDIETYSRIVVGSEPWRLDPKCIPIPWRPVERKNKLKIGVMWNDGVVYPTPPVQRALKHTTEKLKLAGHELVDWSPEGHAEIIQLMAGFFVADGGKTVKSILAPVSEPMRPEMEAYGSAEELGVCKLWEMQAKRTALITAYLARVRAAGLDAILCPTTPYACVEHTKFKYVGYTGVFNVLDYSAVSFPTGLVVDQAVDVAPAPQTELSDYDGVTRKEYNVAAIHGMPISMQLVAGRLQEEKLLDMTQQVLDSLAV